MVALSTYGKDNIYDWDLDNTGWFIYMKEKH